jgi:nucleotide-binding universal stress UspA family protein
VREPEFDAEAYLTRVEERQRAASPNIPVHRHMRRGHPADQIVNTARELGAALVVMTTHGRTGIQRLMAGSVAGRVVEHGQEPVVLIGPAALSARDQAVN